MATLLAPMVELPHTPAHAHALLVHADIIRARALAQETPAGSFGPLPAFLEEALPATAG